MSQKFIFPDTPLWKFHQNSITQKEEPEEEETQVMSIPDTIKVNRAVKIEKKKKNRRRIL